MYVFTFQSWSRLSGEKLDIVARYESLDSIPCDIFLRCRFFHLIQNTCLANPCKNNATCQSGFTEKGYRCWCTAGFKGQTCDEGIAIL